MKNTKKLVYFSYSLLQLLFVFVFREIRQINYFLIQSECNALLGSTYICLVSFLKFGCLWN